MEIDTDDELLTFLRTLLTMEFISHPSAKGVVKQAINKGMGSLSTKQMNVLDLVPVDFQKGPCMRCGESLSYAEKEAALFSSSCLCNWCEHMSMKD